MFHHLLVPLDGSKLAEAALPLATAVAKKFGSQIILVYAVHLPYYVGDGLDFSEVYGDVSLKMEKEAKNYLLTKQNKLQAAGFHTTTEIVVGQPPAEAILQTADQKLVDTIVMSTHGRGGVMRWVFGSVADKVLRNAKVPVLLARAPENQAPEASEPALENAHR